MCCIFCVSMLCGVATRCCALGIHTYTGADVHSDADADADTDTDTDIDTDINTDIDTDTDMDTGTGKEIDTRYK